MKRNIALFLAVWLLVSLCPAAAAKRSAEPEEETEETAAPVVELRSAGDFADFAAACALDTYSRGVTFSLTADIDLSNTDFAPVPYFAGTFLGNGHLILGLELTADGSRVGLFRTIAPEGAVSGLHVRGTVTPGGTRQYVGGVAGVNYGLIENCSFEGTVSGRESVGGIVGSNGAGSAVTGCDFRGDVTGEHQVGGIAGENLGFIDRCGSAGAVNTVLITPEGEPSFDLSAFSQEDFLDLANIGGIAGDNQGVISACRNTGDVGYKNTGYNVGGIAGKTSGYITECENRGEIQGRRDAGGIAGQLVPYVVWSFTDDTMDALAGELGTMRFLISSASLSAGEQNTALSEALAGMSTATSQAITSLESVISAYAQNENLLRDRVQIDPDTGEITIREADLTGVDTVALTSALANLYANTTVLTGQISSSLSSVTGDLSAIASQTARVMDGMYAALAQVSDGTLFTTRDLSAEETYDHDLGAVADCLSYGVVTAENNAGGIVGAIGFEIDFDREDRLNVTGFLTSNAEQSLFAAVRMCASYGEVTAQDSRAGGIAGSMDTGCLADCVSAGAVTARNGDYAGGTAGYASGTVTGCWARSVLSGGKYVGGIAGQGENILRSRAWAHIAGGREYTGAVAGWAEGTIEENLYVTGEIAGVDGVSLSGRTDPVTDTEMLALEDAPESFGVVTVTFVAGDTVIAEQEVAFGGALADLPTVENDGDAYWQWDEFDTEHIYYSRTVTGKYYAPGTTLSWGGEPPELLVEGIFYQGQALTAVPYDAVPEGEEVLAAYTLLVNDYDGQLTVHLRSAGQGGLTLIQNGEARQATYRVDGQYIVFTLPNGGSFVYTAPTQDTANIPPIAIGGAALLAAAATAGILSRRKKKASAPQAAEASEAEKETEHENKDQNAVL